VVVVVGGMGSLGGALIASLLIGLMQTFAVGLDWSFIGGFQALGVEVTEATFGYPVWKLKLTRWRRSCRICCWWSC
jgi:branched-chain amino acid transport system permease protein